MARKPTNAEWDIKRKTWVFILPLKSLVVSVTTDTDWNYANLNHWMSVIYGDDIFRIWTYFIREQLNRDHWDQSYHCFRTQNMRFIILINIKISFVLC